MSDNFPKITVGIPTYNQAHFLGETLKSVLAQTYTHLEIIVSDDASTDDTAQIVLPFLTDKRVRYVRHTHNLGRVANYRHLLYELATGDFYLNLDGDDKLFYDHFLAEALLSLQGDTVFYQGYAAFLQTDGSILNKNPRKTSELLRGADFVKNYWSNPYFAHCATVFNRKKALELDFYNHNALNTDFESLMRLALKGSVILTHETVALWRAHPNNASLQQHVQFRNTPETATLERIAAATQGIFSEKETKNWLKKAYDWHDMLCWYQRSLSDISWATWRALLPKTIQNWAYCRMTLRLTYQLITGRR